MLGQPGKGEINLLCKELVYPEFPQILFGKNEDGRSFFDATHYLSKQMDSKPVMAFFNQYRYLIHKLCEIYEIDQNEVCLINQEGHYLIDGNFMFLFISFVEPGFLAFINDRLFDLFIYGVAISDTYLVSAARRLPAEVLMAIKNDQE